MLKSCMWIFALCALLDVAHCIPKRPLPEKEPLATKADDVELPKRCTQPPKTGLCRAAFTNFYFDSKEQECKTFTYGGCGGNRNRFDSLEECSRTCQKSLTTDSYQKEKSPELRKKESQDASRSKEAMQLAQSLLPKMESLLGSSAEKMKLRSFAHMVVFGHDYYFFKMCQNSKVCKYFEYFKGEVGLKNEFVELKLKSIK